MWTQRVASGVFGRLAAMWIVACAVAGCVGDGDAPARLEGREFLLESAEGFEPVAGTTVQLSFDDGRLGFHAGCNSHSGDFELRDGRLIVVALSSTDIGCDLERGAQDHWLATFFTSSPRVLLDGDRLTLANDEATLVFLDREVADPDRPLAGTLWSIDTLVTADAASNVPLSPPPTVLFNEDGTLQVDTTCNTSGGHYAVSGNTLTLSDIAYTEAGCNAPTIEAHIQSVIGNGTLAFTIEAARLTLQRGDLGLGASVP